MSFLFKSKSKTGPPQGLPQATRNIHTSDGTPGPSTALSEKPQDRKAQSPPPNVVANGSLNSLNSLQGVNPPQNGPQAPFVKRERAGSEAAARPNMRPQQAPAAQQPPHDLYPWSQKQLTFQGAHNPFPRYGAAVNGTASKEGDIYLMGGLIEGEMVRGDLWMIEAATGQLACYPIATVSEGPGPRVGHSSLLVGNAFIVFGGDTKTSDTDILDDTLYLLNTSSRQWSRASPPGTRPAGRYGHSLNILGSKIYIFGGQVEGTFYNDLIAFDLNALQVPTNQWEFLIPNTNTDMSRPTVPPARTNHTMVSYHDMLYLFGGTDGTKWFNDVWTYDPRTNKWSQQDCIGYIPAPREGHSAALVNDVMYIFGGRTETGDDLGDLAAFKISIRRWYTFQNMGPSPSPRSGHSMTAYNKQIIVLAGEPSTTARDPEELSMAYILDTAKIRYPPDVPMSQQKSIEPSSPTRKTSDTGRNMVNARSTSREGQVPNGPEAPQAFQGGPVQRPDPANSKIPRQSIIAAQTGPPPPNQAPNPRPNGVQQQGMAPNQGPRGKSPAEAPVLKQYTGEPPRQAPPEPTTQAREASRQAGSRDASPAGPSSRRTASQSSVTKAKAMEAGEAAPLVGASVARQRSLRSQRAHSSLDGSDDGTVVRTSSGRAAAEHRNSKSFADEPNSPKITPHQEALMRELEATKSKNAWFASELALARKAGYTAASSPTVDDRSTMQFADEDRPLVEAFMNMRNELVKMQQSMETQAHSTAKRIAEIEHQRDAAVTEAAYARAKLAAHGGSARSTPQLGPSRDGDEADRSTDISRRLALALAATNEHKTRIDAMTDELNAERRAREAAEDSAEAAQRRLNEMDGSRNTGELEGLRAELHEAQNLAREEAGQRTDMEQRLRMLELDHKDLNEKHLGVSEQMTDHIGSLTALQAAVAASTSKAQLFERQVDEEREQRDVLEKKLSSLRAQHEEQTQELENTSRRLRETEELAETHAKEASTHREALMTGLAKISRPDSALAQDAKHDDRVAALQLSTDRANALAKSNQQAADASAQKLRSAEERIAGLEAYQEQSSREGLSVRRQLQTALRDLQNHQNDNRELRALLESHQRDTSALAVQHGALKDLLGERGVDMSTARRSPNSDRPSSRFDTPDIQQMRELREQLQSSMKAHEDTKVMFESREHEAEKAYRERLEQLENDYQSLLTYVKGTERMLKRMKEELTKYKTANQKLMNELESTKDGKRSAGSAESSDPETWTAERDALQSSIDDIRAQMATQIEQLEANMAHVKSELVTAQADRDQQKASHEALQMNVQQREKELTELKSENSMLEQRALDAEDRVTMLLDQVGSSVNSYRRQSQLQPLPNAGGHAPTGGHQHQPSASTLTDTSSHTDGEGPEEARGSVALDNLASELETLKAQWESQSRNYRLSDRFDFERTPTRETVGSANASGSDLSSALAGWRQGLAGGDQHDSSNSGMATAAAVAAAGSSH